MDQLLHHYELFARLAQLHTALFILFIYKHRTHGTQGPVYPVLTFDIDIIQQK